MIVVKPNILTSFNLKINEEIIIKTIHIDEGIVINKEGKKYIQYRLVYRAYLKRLYLEKDKDGIYLKDKAPTILIDNIDYNIIVYVPKDMPISTIGDMYQYFNEEFVKYLEDKNILTKEDYIIVKNIEQ